MLFNLLLLLTFLFLVFGYGASILYVKIKDFEYAYLFWILYIVTILTVIEIIFCFVMYFKYKNKEGSIGPRGFQGYPGPKGDKGKCDPECNMNLIILLFIQMIETNETEKLSEIDKKNIYDNFNKETVKNFVYTLSNQQVDKLYNYLSFNYNSTKISGIVTKIKIGQVSDADTGDVLVKLLKDLV